MLQLVDVHAGYGHTAVLRGVSLSVPAGEVTALLGRNGMGKTTTIRCVVGLITASSGSIYLGEQELTHLPIHARARLGVGFVPETRQVFPSLTVMEHLTFAARNDAQGQNAWPIERLVELFPVLGQRASAKGLQLSGGEQQILVLARALTTNPQLLLLDEPTEGLAPVIVDEIAGMIQQLCAEPNSPAILLVEQNLRFALPLAHHACVLVKGEVAFDGSAAVLAADSDLQHSLIGLGSA